MEIRGRIEQGRKIRDRSRPFALVLSVLEVEQLLELEDFEELLQVEQLLKLTIENNRCFFIIVCYMSFLYY